MLHQTIDHDASMLSGLFLLPGSRSDTSVNALECRLGQATPGCARAPGETDDRPCMHCYCHPNRHLQCPSNPFGRRFVNYEPPECRDLYLAASGCTASATITITNNCPISVGTTVTWTTTIVVNACSDLSGVGATATLSAGSLTPTSKSFGSLAAGETVTYVATSTAVSGSQTLTVSVSASTVATGVGSYFPLTSANTCQGVAASSPSPSPSPSPITAPSPSPPPASPTGGSSQLYWLGFLGFLAVPLIVIGLLTFYCWDSLLAACRGVPAPPVAPLPEFPVEPKVVVVLRPVGVMAPPPTPVAYLMPSPSAAYPAP
eukprot:TRINITY_DN834_c0_g1_i1.p1 TRINITY_DN834_c0_g1~~TRINITY_DN834_c0_g1_i1.p1  ORF type:complete len:317 (-),score=40.14 TRINITY_DN834_c0_g1_i1:317-1267(-)